MRSVRHPHLLIALAFALGLLMRLVSLGSLPLTDAEAVWALEARQAAGGGSVLIGANTAYVALTTLFFFATGSTSNFLARLAPALVGSGIVLVPVLFHRRLGEWGTIALAFFLALDPGLVASSRQAGGTIMAVVFLLAAWGFWSNQRLAGAGIAAGMALLSGVGLWPGVLVLAIGRLVAHFVGRADRPQIPWTSLRTVVIYGLATILVAGTLLFTLPGGLTAWMASLPAFIQGWAASVALPAGVMLFSLPAYQPLAIVLAVVAIAIRRDHTVQFLALWAVLALALAAIYPGRQMHDLLWVVIPLWALAALSVEWVFATDSQELWQSLGAAGLVLLVLIFSWMNFVSLMRTSVPADQQAMRGWLLAGSLLLLILSALLVAWGWSPRVARAGLSWGVVAALTIYSLSALMSSAGLRAIPNAVDLWSSRGRYPQADLLLKVVQQLSGWSATEKNAQPVTIAGVDSPAMQWLFRDRQVVTSAGIDPAANDPIVISVNQDQPVLDAGYRGESIVWTSEPVWTSVSFGDLLSWLPFHQRLQDPRHVILWVRRDLFPGASAPKP